MPDLPFYKPTCSYCFTTSPLSFCHSTSHCPKHADTHEHLIVYRATLNGTELVIESEFYDEASISVIKKSIESRKDVGDLDVRRVNCVHKEEIDRSIENSNKFVGGDEEKKKIKDADEVIKDSFIGDKNNKKEEICIANYYYIKNEELSDAIISDNDNLEERVNRDNVNSRNDADFNINDHKNNKKYKAIDSFDKPNSLMQNNSEIINNKENNIETGNSPINSLQDTTAAEKRKLEENNKLFKFKCDLSGCEIKNNLYLCLTCGFKGCGRVQYGKEGNGHALDHYSSTGHCINASMVNSEEEDFNTYCYKCDEYIVNSKIKEDLERLGIKRPKLELISKKEDLNTIKEPLTKERETDDTFYEQVGFNDKNEENTKDKNTRKSDNKVESNSQELENIEKEYDLYKNGYNNKDFKNGDNKETNNNKTNEINNHNKESKQDKNNNNYNNNIARENCEENKKEAESTEQIIKEEQHKFVGIKNAGNTCYMSVIFQMISLSIKESLEDHFYLCVKEDPLDCYTCQFIKIISALQNKSPDIEINDYLQVIEREDKTFSRFLQQDPSEFLMFLLIRLDDEANYNRMINISERYKIKIEDSKICNNCPDSNIFEYQECGVAVSNKDFNEDISGSILAQYTVETYNCHCGGTKTNTKQMIALPEWLIITVNLIDFEPNRDMKKIEAKDSLENSIRLHENGKSVEYRLKCIILHRGDSAKAGHYVLLVDDIVINDSKIEIEDKSGDKHIYLYERI